VYGACRISGVTGKNLRLCVILASNLVLFTTKAGSNRTQTQIMSRIRWKIAQYRKFLPVTLEILHAPYNIEKYWQFVDALAAPARAGSASAG